MRREDLEHLIRAASAITNEEAFIIIGSQSILGKFPNAAEDLVESRKADMFSKK